MNRMLRGATVLATIGLVQPAFAASMPLVTTQPDPSPDVAPFFVADADPRWSDANWSAQDIAMLRQKVKYVFVIFNENRSFDHEYGTLPGVNGLYSDGKNPRGPADTPGFSPDLSRHEHRAERHRSAVSRRPRAEFDHQGFDRPFARRSRRQDRRQGRRRRKWTSSRSSSGIVMRIPAAHKARRWASSSPAS